MWCVACVLVLVLAEVGVSTQHWLLTAEHTGEGAEGGCG
jgi:hypothetical protein